MNFALFRQCDGPGVPFAVVLMYHAVNFQHSQGRRDPPGGNARGLDQVVHLGGSLRLQGPQEGDLVVRQALRADDGQGRLGRGVQLGRSPAGWSFSGKRSWKSRRISQPSAARPAPSRMRRLQPTLAGASMGPGTA